MEYGTMTNPKDDQSREEFEKWYNWKLEGCPETLRPDPDWLFSAWQASRATTSEAVRELVEALKSCHDELESIHSKYGDKLHARKHSAALFSGDKVLAKFTTKQEALTRFTDTEK